MDVENDIKDNTEVNFVIQVRSKGKTEFEDVENK